MMLAHVRFSEQPGKASQDRPGSAELLLERGPAVVVRREIGSSPGWVVSATVRVTRQGRHPTQAHRRIRAVDEPGGRIHTSSIGKRCVRIARLACTSAR
jgi:hypothetical protein